MTDARERFDDAAQAGWKVYCSRCGAETADDPVESHVCEAADQQAHEPWPVYYEFGDGPAARAQRIEELARRLLTEYDEDMKREPSFVTMDLLRDALESEPRPSSQPERQFE